MTFGEFGRYHIKILTVLRRCECLDLFKIVRELGLEVKYDDYGKLKGIYTTINRNPYIFINNTPDRYTQHLVCAHKIGHDRLQRDLVRDGWMREFDIYNMNNRPEYEANLFASKVLIDDDEILELVSERLKQSRSPGHYIRISILLDSSSRHSGRRTTNSVRSSKKGIS